MRSINRVQLVGRLGRDPEMRYSQSGLAIVKMSVATDYGSGDRKKTDWHSCTAFGDLAEQIVDQCTKGSGVDIDGRISYSTSEKDGVKRYFTEIICNACDLLDDENQEGRDPAPASPPEGARARPANIGPDDFDDDIPF